MQINTKFTFRFYWRHLLRYKGLTLLCFFGLFLGATADMIMMMVLKFFIDALAVVSDDAYRHALSFLGLFFALGLLSTVGWQIVRYGASALQSRVAKNIADECFDQLHHHSFRFFNNQFVGALVKRVNRMTRAFVDISDLVFLILVELFFVP